MIPAALIFVEPSVTVAGALTPKLAIEVPSFTHAASTPPVDQISEEVSHVPGPSDPVAGASSGSQICVAAIAGAAAIARGAIASIRSVALRDTESFRLEF